MGRRKIVVSDLVFNDNEPIKDKVLKFFDTEYIIRHFNKNTIGRFNKVINHKNVQLILRDKSLMNTVSAFFSNGLNTSNTSEKTYMHRNTLNYRLDKIRRYTGLNLRQFEHALVFKNLIIIDGIIKELKAGPKIERIPKQDEMQLNKQDNLQVTKQDGIQDSNLNEQQNTKQNGQQANKQDKKQLSEQGKKQVKKI